MRTFDGDPMAPRSRTGSLLGLLGWLLLCYAVAALGAFASIHAAEFYLRLSRPAWSPPAWVFGPAWSVLYTMMAVAAWRVWRAPATRPKRTAYACFVAQLAANALWSWLFFGWHLGAFAAAEVLVLLASIVATIVSFAPFDRPAAVLLAPYLAWVAFASALTASVWLRNPGVL